MSYLSRCSEGEGEVPKGGGGNTLRKKGRGENIAPEAVSEEGGVGGDEAPSFLFLFYRVLRRRSWRINRVTDRVPPPLLVTGKGNHLTASSNFVFVYIFCKTRKLKIRILFLH